MGVKWPGNVAPLALCLGCLATVDFILGVTRELKAVPVVPSSAATRH